MHAAKKAVNDPQNKITIDIAGWVSKKKEHLSIRNTPAVTIVAAWINEDTGVGPSIASASHIWKPACADLPTADITKRKHTIFFRYISVPKNRVLSKQVNQISSTK